MFLKFDNVIQSLCLLARCMFLVKYFIHGWCQVAISQPFFSTGMVLVPMCCAYESVAYY